MTKIMFFKEIQITVVEFYLYINFSRIYYTILFF